MTRMSAIGVALLAGILAAAAPVIAGQRAAARIGTLTSTVQTGPLQLTADIPAALRRGEAATLILHVSKAGHAVDRSVACLAAVPLFISVEDALDTTPAGGVDLGSASALGPQPACAMAIAGTASGSGRYMFTWEPDTAGRVNLTFTAAGGTLTMPVDVASAPPATAVLASFIVLVVITPGAAVWLRRRRLRSKSAGA